MPRDDDRDEQSIDRIGQACIGIIERISPVLDKDADRFFLTEKVQTIANALSLLRGDAK